MIILPHFHGFSSISVTSAFSPLSLSPALWLDAADSSTLFSDTAGNILSDSGGLVRRWNDKSTNNRHVTEATNPPTRQTSIQNSRDIIRYTGSQKLAHSSNSVWNFLHNGSSPYYIFIVARFGTISEPDALYTLIDTAAFASANIGFSFGLDDRSAFSYDKSARFFVARAGGSLSTSTCSSIVNNTLTPNTYSLISIRGDMANSTVANRANIRVNRADTTNGNSLNNTASTANSTHPLTIGTMGGTPNFSFIGDICEIIIIPSDLTTTQRNDCELYLRNKWDTLTP
jgi:hypothetical protein